MTVQGAISLLVILFFFLYHRFRDSLLLLWACFSPKIIIKALGTFLKLLGAALIIVLTTVSQEYLDALVESVEIRLRLISEMPAIDGGIEGGIPIGLLKLRFVDNW